VVAASTQLAAVVDSRDGGAEFRDLEVPRELTEVAAGVSPVMTSAPIQALAVSLLEVPADSEAESAPHPAPRAQLIVVLTGAIEIDTGSDRRRFGAGEVLLTADSAGRGHITRIAERPTSCMFVVLDPDAVARLLARR
jgi:quercetin dioxygenase-like cupin family protein